MKTKFKGILIFLLAFVAQLSFAQQRLITGKVTDNNGLPVAGCNISEKGSTNGVSSNFDGEFAINSSVGKTLVISYVGYTTQEKTIVDSRPLSIVLQEDISLLDEVVVVAYGTQKKEEITGAVTNIKAEKLALIPSGSVLQGLVGQTPGVQIINETGAPGANPTIRFRGFGSINSLNDPLFVVDGVVFNGNLNSINQQDIASISFLKDASSNALYGSRGANGVVIITTKKGTSNKVEITIDSKVGFNTRAVPEYDIITDPRTFYEAAFDRVRIGLITRSRNPLSPEDAAQFAADNIVNNLGYPLGYNNFNVPENEIIDPSTGRVNPNAQLLYQDDWQDAAYITGFRQEHYLSLKYSNDYASTFFSIGNSNDEGILINSGFERTTARLAVDLTPKKWLKINTNINYAHTVSDNPLSRFGTEDISNIAGWARNVAPIYPIFERDVTTGAIVADENGNRIFDFGNGANGGPLRPPFFSNSNPIATSLLDIDDNLSDNFSGRFSASFKFLKDFEFTYNLSADIVNGNFTRFATPVGGDAGRFGGRITSVGNRSFTFVNQQLLNWDKTFGKHSLSLLLGHESNAFNFRQLAGEVTNAVIENLAVLNNGSNIQFVEGYQRDYNVEGYFSRLNYNLSKKYFFNASFRRDGSSVFAPENKWGNFYGLGTAWTVHKEDFFNVPFINSLKLKASIGQQGNDAILFEDDRRRIGDQDNRNYFAYLDQSDVINAGGGASGISFFQLGNRNLVWETSTNFNSGFELSALDNRLNISAEYFIRDVNDLLFFDPTPLSEGVGGFPENVADLSNKGIEVALGLDVIKSKKWLWALNLNATHYKNEVSNLPDEFIDSGNFRLTEGRSVFDYFLREFAGVDPSNGDALWFTDILDANGLPTGERTTTNDVSQATEYFLDKSAIPDLFGGFQTDLTYKNFSLNVGFSYQIGGYGYDLVYQRLLRTNNPGNNFHRDVFQSWTPETPNAGLPRLDNFSGNQVANSSLFLVDASYLNLQNVTLSYTLNPNITKRLGIANATIYATGNNLKLWTKARKGFDPRLSQTGASSNEFSLARTTSFGVTLNF